MELNNTMEAEVPVEKTIKVNADLRKFNKAEAQVSKSVAALSTIKIENKDDVEPAMGILKSAKTVQTLIEDKRKELVKPYNESVAKINEYAKNLTAKLPPAIEAGKKIIIDWQKAEQERIKKQKVDVRLEVLVSMGFKPDEFGTYACEGYTICKSAIENSDDVVWSSVISESIQFLGEAQYKNLKALESEKDLTDLFGSDEDVKDLNEKIGSIKQPSISAPAYAPGPSFSKIKGSTKRWVFKVENVALIPREYLMADEVKIRKCVAEGMRLIPGVNIYQEDGISIR